MCIFILLNRWLFNFRSWQVHILLSLLCFLVREEREQLCLSRSSGQGNSAQSGGCSSVSPNSPLPSGLLIYLQMSADLCTYKEIHIFSIPLPFAILPFSEHAGHETWRGTSGRSLPTPSSGLHPHWLPFFPPLPHVRAHHLPALSCLAAFALAAPVLIAQALNFPDQHVS